MRKYGERWGNMEKYGEIWGNMEKYGRDGGNIEKYGEIWRNMGRDGEIWWRLFSRLEKLRSFLIFSLILECLINAHTAISWCGPLPPLLLPQPVQVHYHYLL
jgi:hypothetical protein